MAHLPVLLLVQTEILGEFTYVPEGVEVSESGEQQYVYVPVDFNGVDAETGFISEDGTSVQCFTVGPDGVLIPTQPDSGVEIVSETIESVEAIEVTQEVVHSADDDFEEPFEEDPKEPASAEDKTEDESTEATLVQDSQ